MVRRQGHRDFARIGGKRNEWYEALELDSLCSKHRSTAPVRRGGAFAVLREELSPGLNVLDLVSGVNYNEIRKIGGWKGKIVMYLRKQGICNRNMETKILFEMVAEDLGMLRVKIQSENNGIPSYWRIGRAADIPPSEIGINCETGHISKVVLFVDPNTVEPARNWEVPVKNGTVAVDTSIFHCVNDFVDVDKEFFSFMYQDKIVFLFEEHPSICEAYRTGRLEVYLDELNQVIGIGVQKDESQGDDISSWPYVG